MTKVKDFFLAHKVVTGIVAVIIIIGGYYSYKSLTNTSGETRYVLSAVQKGTVIVSTTGTGQVVAINQLSLKPQASGNIIALNVKSGDTVTQGEVIAKIDPTDAQNQVNSAQLSLDNANLSLQKLTEPATQLQLTQAQDNLDKAKEDQVNAQTSLAQAYDNGFTSVANTFLTLPNVMTGLQNILYTSDPTLAGNNGQENINYYNDRTAQVAGQQDVTTSAEALNFLTATNTAYNQALSDYNADFANYKATTRTADPADLEKLINQTYAATTEVADSVKNASNLIQLFENTLTNQNLKIPAVANTQLASFATYTGQLDSSISSLSSALSSITTNKQAITDSANNITEDTQTQAQLVNGPDPLDIQSSQLSVKQQQNALLVAQQNLDNYYVRAPFDGVIGTLSVNLGDSVSSGTAIATLVSKSQIAQITLNEVDVAKIKLGDKATLTFDALSGLTITGEVAEIDTVGTVSQGVVTYGVQISFDTQDDRIKPGMSLSAAIITDMSQDVLVVPNSAVKTQGSASYVQMFDTALPAPVSGVQGSPSKVLPRQQAVVTGLSDDASTEIVSGLNEGDMIVTRTITPSTTTATTSAPSILGAAAGGRGGIGGAVRAPTTGR